MKNDRFLFSGITPEINGAANGQAELILLTVFGEILLRRCYEKLEDYQSP